MDKNKYIRVSIPSWIEEKLTRDSKMLGLPKGEIINRILKNKYNGNRKEDI